MPLYEELKRRNVFRVGAAYLVLAWLLLQLGDVVFEALGLETAQIILLVILALGFIPTLVFAWVFELTPEGLKKDADVSPGESVSTHTGHKLNIVIVALLAMALGSFLLGRLSVDTERNPTLATPESAPAETEPADSAPPSNEGISMAVLAFADLSPTGDQGFFSDGIAEEILNVLSRVSGLRVASRTSAFRFKDRPDLGIPDIASQLNVRYVLEGSVRKAGDTIRVTAQLIDGRSDTHLWSQAFDRQLSVENILAIQDEIATTIVAQLGGSMNLGRTNTIQFAAAADTADLRAYELYLEGRDQFLHRGDGVDIEGMIRLLEEAVERDPEFAHAWNSLSGAYKVAPSWLAVPGLPELKRNYPSLSSQAAEKALSLNPDLGLSIAVKALNTTIDGMPDYLTYIDELSRAVERDPDESTLWNWRGQTYTDLGFFDLAETDLNRCLALDPGNAVALAWLMRIKVFRGESQAAHALLERLPNLSGGPLLLLTMELADTGDLEHSAALFHLLDSSGRFDSETFLLPLVRGDIDYDAAFARFVQALRENVGVDLEAQLPNDLAFYFKQYSRIAATAAGNGQNIWWAPMHSDFMNSQHWNRVMENQGIFRYWRDRGPPPQCRALPMGGFECDPVRPDPS